MESLPYPPPRRPNTGSDISSVDGNCQPLFLDSLPSSAVDDSPNDLPLQPQERYEALIAAIDGIAWEADIYRVQFTFVSAKAEPLLGYAIAEWQQPSFWVEHLYPPDLEPTIAYCQQALCSRQPYEMEYRMVAADGRLVWLRDSATLVSDATGKPIRLVGVSTDISDRKQSETALRHSHNFLQTVLNHLPVAVFVKDGRPKHFGKFTFWNKTAERLFGWTAEQTLGKTVYDCLPQKQAERFDQRDRESFQQPTNQTITEEILYGDNGEQSVLRTLYIPLLDEQQAPQYLLGISEDITERQQAEKAQRQQAEREALVASISRDIRQSLDLKKVLSTTVAEVRQFLQTDRVIIFRLRPDWSGMVLVESVQHRWESVLGKIFNDPCFSQVFAELYKRGRTRAITDIRAENSPVCYRNMLAELQARAILIVPILQEGNLWGLLVAHHCSAPREWLPFEVDLLKQLSAQVSIAIEQSELYQQVQCLNADLERQVQIRTAELQLASEFEATLKRITDRVRDSLDEDQILQNAIRELAMAIGVTGCNAAIYDLDRRTSKVSYEYTDSLMRLQGRVVNMDNFSEGYRQLLEGEYFQFCSLVPNPLRGYVAMFACPILDDQGVLGDLWLVSQKYRSFNDQDIRLVQQVANQCAIAIRQARLYQEAQAQVVELEKLNRLKDDFLSTVSHELRTPMSNIKLATQMLEINLRQMGLLDNNSSGLSRYFHILKQECQREISLINDLLDLSRLETGESLLNWQIIDLTTWLLRLVQPFLERAQSQRQTLEIDIPDQIPPLLSDPSHLERILSELLSNACKYTPAGETMRLVVRVLKHAGHDDSSVPPSTSTLHISVINTGVEILPDQLTRIFDKFYRIPDNDPWKHGGTGLGLALVKKLVETLSGDIWASSETGQVCFVIELPFSHGTSSVQPSSQPPTDSHKRNEGDREN